jgi:DNA-binding response OmpR family regulator
MQNKILIVDDEPRFLKLLEANLSSAGYEIIQASNGKIAIEKVSDHQPDLVLLDVMMPKMDGFQVLDRIRKFSSTPIIMLTARGEEENRVEGLNRGADDYLVKPFSATELIARVNAVLRRAKNAMPEHSKIFIHNDLQIDFAKAEVTLGSDVIMLSATEYRLLLQFALNVGHILAPEDLLFNVWGEEYKQDKEILWVCISRLRQKLENNPKIPVHIVTRSGAGYTMPSVN